MVTVKVNEILNWFHSNYKDDLGKYTQSAEIPLRIVSNVCMPSAGAHGMTAHAGMISRMRT